jgi:hypothetical protein
MVRELTTGALAAMGVACRNRAHIDRGVHRERPGLSAVTAMCAGDAHANSRPGSPNRESNS